jgi:hypothetical protein
VKQLWYEVKGRGSGLPLAGVHHADVEKPHGEMITLCGVGISVAILSSRLRRGQHYCTVCSRLAKVELAKVAKSSAANDPPCGVCGRELAECDCMGPGGR